MKGFKTHGVQYRCGAIVRVKILCEPGMLPFKYAQIKEIYVYEDQKVMLMQVVEVISAIHHLRAITVTITEEMYLSHYNNLYCHGVLHLKQLESNYYIVEKDHWNKQTFFC